MALFSLLSAAATLVASVILIFALRKVRYFAIVEFDCVPVLYKVVLLCL